MSGLAGIPETPTAFLRTIEDLIKVARDAGRPDASARTIRGWRDRHRISEPSRHRRELRYPLAALAEVDGIVRWSARGKNAKRLTFARFIEAGTVKASVAVDACQSLLDDLNQGATEVATLTAAGEEAI
jgi:hypothetical protein